MIHKVDQFFSKSFCTTTVAKKQLLSVPKGAILQNMTFQFIRDGILSSRRIKEPVLYWLLGFQDDLLVHIQILKPWFPIDSNSLVFIYYFSLTVSQPKQYTLIQSVKSDLLDYLYFPHCLYLVLNTQETSHFY